MFRDDAQAAKVCISLCNLVGIENAWNLKGPERLAFRVRDGEDGLSTRERILVRVAWALWNRQGEVQLLELLELDPRRLAIVCALLVAVATHPEQVDAWLSERVAEWYAERGLPVPAGTA
jgi:hypothetical protein